MEELKEIFGDLKDPRDNRGKRHLLIDIIVMTVCGILYGCCDFEDVADYAQGQKDFLSKYLLLWNGIPKAKTFREVFKVIDVGNFLECFMIWIKSVVPETLGEHIIIDGKAIRAATEKVAKGKIPYIVNAYLAGAGITLGQLKVDQKSNEITAIPKLLDLITVKGAIITIDAIGTQEKIMDKIVDKEADFVLPVKLNQKEAYNELKEYFEQEDLKENKFYVENSQTIYSKDHGRIETRSSIVSTEVDWFKDSDKWKNVNLIAMTKNTREINGKKTEQIKYYVSSKIMDADSFNSIVRNHWQIENNLHWVLDVTFKEDQSRGRKGNLMENFSLLRKFCLNIIKLDTRFGNISIKRKINKYRFQENAFEELLFEVIPSLRLV